MPIGVLFLLFVVFCGNVWSAGFALIEQGVGVLGMHIQVELQVHLMELPFILILQVLPELTANRQYLLIM